MDDEKYSGAADRVRLKESLEQIVSLRLSAMKTSEVVTKLQERGVPFGKFNTVSSLLQDPHFLGREILKSYELLRKEYRTIVNPVIVDGR